MENYVHSTEDHVNQPGQETVSNENVSAGNNQQEQPQENEEAAQEESGDKQQVCEEQANAPSQPQEVPEAQCEDQKESDDAQPSAKEKEEDEFNAGAAEGWDDNAWENQ